MRTRKLTLILVVLLLTLNLAACQRPASKAPTGVTAPTTGALDFVVSTQVSQALMDDAVKATETAIALAASLPTDAVGGEAVENQAAPEPTEVPAVSNPETGRPATYRLQPGEWPICIARRYDLDVAAFLAVNGLDLSSKPAAGATLNIPQSGNWSSNYGARALQAHPVEYTVNSGDTIYTIACRYGDVSPEAIISANQLSETGAISVGQILQIP
jgi:LysM repeat protein